MKITCKNQYLKLPNGGYLIHPEIRDIYTYKNRFSGEVKVEFGIFNKIDDTPILYDTITLVFSEENKRTGYVVYNAEDSSEVTIPIEQYYMENGSLDGATVLDWGMPSPELVLEYFTGGTNLITDTEIFPSNDLAKSWVLHTLEYKGASLIQNFEFDN